MPEHCPAYIANKPWLRRSYDNLQFNHTQGKLAHGLLLYGSPGLGKLELAKSLALMLLCIGATTPKPCGSCRGCKLVESGSHPDLLWLELLEKKQMIAVDQVRYVIEQLTLKSHQGGYRVVICPELNSISLAGANSLLKLLEEPPSNTVIICCTSTPGTLLPTIRSRMQLHRIIPPTKNAACNYLYSEHNIDKVTSKNLLLFAHGAPLRVVEMQQKAFAEQRQQVINLLHMCCDGKLGSLLTVIHNMLSFSLLSNLEIIAACLYDLLVLNFNGKADIDQVYNHENYQQFITWASNLQTREAFSCWDQVLHLIDSCNKGIVLNHQAQLFNLAMLLARTLRNTRQQTT